MCVCVCVCVIGSTAICLCSIWRLQEITGVLQEECVFLHCAVCMYSICVGKCFSKVRKQVGIFSVVLALYSNTLD